jgi:glutaredoxin 3
METNKPTRAIDAYSFAVYTKEGCPECVQVKRLLESKQIAYTAVDISCEVKRQEFYAANPGVRSMPQVFIGGQRVGGMAGVRQALAQISGSLVA